MDRFNTNIQLNFKPGVRTINGRLYDKVNMYEKLKEKIESPGGLLIFNGAGVYDLNRELKDCIGKVNHCESDKYGTLLFNVDFFGDKFRKEQLGYSNFSMSSIGIIEPVSKCVVVQQVDDLYQIPKEI
jgi:hypothetical protein